MTQRVVLAVLVVFVAQAAAQDAEDKKFKLDALEAKLLDMTNAERKKEDLPPLKANARLFKAAREHAQNMAKQEKLAHDLDCKTPFDRIKEAGYEFGGAAENVAYGSADYPLADIMKNWMESEGHRANILHKDFLEIGLGIARTDQGVLYYTQVFGARLTRD